MVKADDQDSTRERIVKAAGELIVEAGWADVTTRQISERAGVNNALIHYYFGSKDDLLLEAARVAFASEVEGPFSTLTGAESVAEALHRFFSWLGTLESDSSSMIISMEAAHRAIRDERVADFLEGIWSQAFERLASLIAQGQASGELREDLDPLGVAIALGAMLDGLFLYRLVAPGFNIDGAVAVVDALIESLTKGRQP